MTTEDVYTFLYGQSGTEYNSTSLLWANANSSLSRKWSVITASNSFGSNRQMNDASHNHCRNLGIYNLNSSFYNYNDFESYVRKVYECIYTTNVIKIKNIATTTDYATYDLGIYSYPVLLNMGLKLNGTNLNIVMKDSSGGDVSGVSPWNSILATYSNMTNDYFTSSFHWGKTRHFGAGHNSSIHGATGMYSKYFLTPNTLGVTYVPLSVLKPNFIGLLQTNIQLNKVSGGDSKLGKDEFKKTITESIGCVGTSVYKTSSGVVANDSQEHITTSNEDIINDGDIEYDLKSVKVKVEYFDCDFYYDKTIPNVISRIEGAVPNWKNDDGSNYGKDSGIYASQVSN